MSLPRKDELIRVIDVPSIVYKITGVKISKFTIYKYINKGVRAYDNRLVKLKVERRLRMIFTTRKWIETFLERISWREESD